VLRVWRIVPFLARVSHKAEKGGESFQLAKERGPTESSKRSAPQATSPRSNPDAISRKKQEIRETIYRRERRQYPAPQNPRICCHCTLSFGYTRARYSLNYVLYIRSNQNSNRRHRLKHLDQAGRHIEECCCSYPTETIRRD
jgi:hypothetical protein